MAHLIKKIQKKLRKAEKALADLVAIGEAEGTAEALGVSQEIIEVYTRDLQHFLENLKELHGMMTHTATRSTDPEVVAAADDPGREKDGN